MAWDGGWVSKPEPPAIWVRVIQTHALKAWMGLTLAVCAGLSLVIISGGAVWNTVANPDVKDLSEGFLTLLGTSLGTVFGGIIGYLSAQNAVNKESGDAINDGDLTLQVPEEKPKEEGLGP
jgi:hypothetical protein